MQAVEVNAKRTQQACKRLIPRKASSIVTADALTITEPTVQHVEACWTAAHQQSAQQDHIGPQQRDQVEAPKLGVAEVKPDLES